MQTSAIILAAGRSRRMGEPKLALAHQGATVLEVVLRALGRPGVQQRVVVLGHHRDRLEPLALLAGRDGPPVVIAVNPDPEGDMASSVRIGVGAACVGADWFLITPADLPALQPGSVDRLLAEAKHCLGLKRPPIVVPTCKGRTGHPLAVPAALRADVLAAAPGWTLRDWVYGDAYPVREVEVDDEGIFRDLDVPADRQILE